MKNIENMYLYKELKNKKKYDQFEKKEARQIKKE